MCVECLQCCDFSGNVKMEVVQGISFGKKVIDVKDILFVFGECIMVCDFIIIIMCGDCIGLIGFNGSGKMMLLKLLLGELQLVKGEVNVGINLQIVYFDQYCVVLCEDWSVIENVVEGCDFFEFNGKCKYVYVYLQDFMFILECVCVLIICLFGGECNCLLLVKLFVQLFNLLVMDELINDLDVEILELLEELLGEYIGMLLLVSYDCDFIDNVVIFMLVMEGDGVIGEYVGGYSDWQCYVVSIVVFVLVFVVKLVVVVLVVVVVVILVVFRCKLVYKEVCELEQLLKIIEKLEGDVEGLILVMNDLLFYICSSVEVIVYIQQFVKVQVELDVVYVCWEELEG